MFSIIVRWTARRYRSSRVPFLNYVLSAFLCTTTWPASSPTSRRFHWRHWRSVDASSEGSSPMFDNVKIGWVHLRDTSSSDFWRRATLDNDLGRIPTSDRKCSNEVSRPNRHRLSENVTDSTRRIGRWGEQWRIDRRGVGYVISPYINQVRNISISNLIHFDLHRSTWRKRMKAIARWPYLLRISLQGDCMADRSVDSYPKEESVDSLFS